MKHFPAKFFSQPFLLVLAAVLVKVPVFFTQHIQEDSFITWRVARNLLDYGVIGFNGEERLSASTTHLYMLISAYFQLVFGASFIYPLLIFSCVVFAIGSLYLGRILFSAQPLKCGMFVFLLNITPPAITASCLGMEYGFLFFLYCALLYFGIGKGKNCAYFVFPVLLLWTRIDTVVFLGIFFLADVILKKKINLLFVLGGLVGLGSVIAFNYFYFGELINHTIAAKKLAYKNLLENNSIEFFLYQWAYYGGLIKKYSVYTFLLWFVFLVFIGWVIAKLRRDTTHSSLQTRVILISLIVFSLVKITVFAYFKAYFDWYYWLPRTFLFAAVFYFLLHLMKPKPILSAIVFFAATGLYGFQFLQSYAIGYMEHSQRMRVANDINSNSPSEKESILLEPAGIIPFYTGLYTYDEVGLVNKKITAEMQNDEIYWWANSVKKFQPDYILTVGKRAGDFQSYYRLKPGDAEFFNENYETVKEYPIAKVHTGAPRILRFIYQIRPIGKDYYLYKKLTKKN